MKRKLKKNSVASFILVMSISSCGQSENGVSVKEDAMNKEVETVVKDNNKTKTGAFLEISLKINEENRGAAVGVYTKYKQPFLKQIEGARSKELLVRGEDVQVIHGFETAEQANAYLKTSLFTNDVVGELGPLLAGEPEIRVYSTAALTDQSPSTTGAFLEITLTIDAANRAAAGGVYAKYKKPFLKKIDGATSKELIIRDNDVQVLHGFESEVQANAYLKSTLFTKDVVGELGPLLAGDPEIRVYKVFK